LRPRDIGYEVGTAVKKLLVLLVLVGAALAAGVYWLNPAGSNGHPEEPFTVTAVEWGSLTETVSATGLLQPHEVTAVGSELSGKVVEIYPGADFNQVVQEGDPLLKLDDRVQRQHLEQAETAVRMAQANLQQAEALREGAELGVARLRELLPSVGSQKELDRAQMNLKAAEAAVMLARVKIEEAVLAHGKAQYGLDLTVVRVPTGTDRTAGSTAKKRHYTVIDRKVVLGQMIGPPASAQLFTLATDLGQMQVHAQVGENDISKVQPGQEATFTVYAYSEDDVRFRGKVVQIRPMPTSTHGAVFYDAVIDVTNERDPKTGEWKLRPGMTAAVDIVLRRHDQVWKMPTAALNFQLEEPYQTEAAKAQLARWQARGDRDDWKAVWVLDGQQKPWPVFVRIGGKNVAGVTGIKDGQYNEVLEWDPELTPAPDSQSSAGLPQVIVGAPPARKRNFLDAPNLKVF
jgi:HlyD family secretion protein